jgi:hypothetical protein
MANLKQFYPSLASKAKLEIVLPHKTISAHCAGPPEKFFPPGEFFLSRTIKVIGALSHV